MFTGIVQTTGRVRDACPTENGLSLTIDHGGWVPEGGYQPAMGHSIAVSGVCLTVVGLDERTFTFDVIPETLSLTRLGDLQPGDRVNLEPAVLPTQAMGGHFVQGHVDGLGEVVAVSREEGAWIITIAAPEAVRPALVPKGSITVDGVSLTLAAVEEEAGRLDVALIPATLSLTTLSGLQVGSRVHLEADVLVKAVVAAFARQQTGRQPAAAAEAAVTMDLLRRSGFAEA